MAPMFSWLLDRAFLNKCEFSPKESGPDERRGSNSNLEKGALGITGPVKLLLFRRTRRIETPRTDFCVKNLPPKPRFVPK